MHFLSVNDVILCFVLLARGHFAFAEALCHSLLCLRLGGALVASLLHASSASRADSLAIDGGAAGRPPALHGAFPSQCGDERAAEHALPRHLACAPDPPPRFP